MSMKPTTPAPPGIWLAAEWRDIEGAPRDGKKFLAFTCDYENGIRVNECVQEARWSGKTPDDRVGHYQSKNGQIVTHWMPLPLPPR